ncbi:hypothetical protein Hdeb2414_s0006g00211511 [Helianthus debilis subsp. tardiflorus]
MEVSKCDVDLHRIHFFFFVRVEAQESPRLFYILQLQGRHGIHYINIQIFILLQTILYTGNC